MYIYFGMSTMFLICIFFIHGKFAFQWLKRGVSSNWEKIIIIDEQINNISKEIYISEDVFAKKKK